MTFTDLILLKAMYNERLHSAVVSKSPVTINGIMFREYQEDIRSHNITDFNFNCEDLHLKHIVEISEVTT